VPWYGGWGGPYGWYSPTLLSDVPSDEELDELEEKLKRKEARMKGLQRIAERLKKGH
jgi:hypothetical protein